MMISLTSPALPHEKRDVVNIRENSMSIGITAPKLACAGQLNMPAFAKLSGNDV